jgi:hypothetical protein
LEENGNSIKVPLIYGNAERWAGARKDGYLRDERGRIQIPLAMFKRNSIERDESLTNFKDINKIASYKKYSTGNRYDRFSIMNNAKPTYEHYNIAVPSYVTITYEVMLWTSFTEHMNVLVEAFQNQSERYWGMEDGFKFKSSISSFETSQEVAQGAERVIRTSFTTTVNAYLLPEIVDNKPTMNKSFSPKRVVWGVETDLSGGKFAGLNVYQEYADVVNFIAIRGHQQAVFVNSTTVKLTNAKKPNLPNELLGVFDVVNWFRVYLNGDFISPIYYTYSYDGNTKEITFTFSLPYPIEIADEVLITGKFQEL